MLQPAVSWMLALALLVPMLLALLPSPVSAEEAQLYRDLQRSRCIEQGIPVPDGKHACDSCVLCCSAGLPRVSEAVDPFTAFAPAAQTVKVSFVFEHLSRADLAAITGPDPGRGPPA